MALNLSLAIRKVQAEWDEWCEDYQAMDDRVRKLESALREVLNFEPVTNGNYAVMEAIPALRKIAALALVGSTDSGETKS